MNNSYYHPDEFDFEDIIHAAFFLLPIVICGVALGLGVIVFLGLFP